jgi:hypothetical protein
MKYAELEDPKVEGCPVFIQGKDHYIKLLEFNSIKILAGFDEEIKTWSQNIIKLDEYREKYI